MSAELEGALVLLDLETLKYHSLNATASAVWEILAEPHTTQDIVQSLCSRYEVSPEHCRASVEDLLANLAKRQLVVEGFDGASAGS